MLFQDFIVSFFITAQSSKERLTERSVIEHRAKGHMEHFPPVKVIQQVGQLVVWPGGHSRYFGQFGGNVIGRPVGGVAFQSKGDNLPEKGRGQNGNGPQRFQVAGTGRFKVNQTSGYAGRNRINTEFIGTGVKTEFVGAKGLGHR